MGFKSIVSNFEKLLKYSAPNAMIPVYQKVLLKLTPFVRGLLSTKFSAAGLHDITGNLRACINQSTLHLNKNGIRISPGGGYDKSVYIALNTFTFGGVVGSGIKSKAIKKKIKRRGVEGLGSGIKIIEGRGLYLLSAGEKAAVQSEFDRLLTLELNPLLKA